MRENLSLLTIALGAGLLSIGLQGQQPLPDDQLSAGSQTYTKPFTLVQITREVDLDIVVTDALGQPVSGLTKEDFQIFEDHRRQRTVSFESRSPGTSPQQVTPNLPRYTYTNAVSNRSGNTSIVILLDSLDTPLKYQLYAYQQTVDFVKSLPSGVDVALFTLNARMELLQGFTSDTKLLLQAMQSRRAQPKSSFLIDSTPGVAILREGSNDVYRKRLLLDGMGILGRYLAGFPGRKNLIWLTVDIPGHRTQNPTGSPRNNLTGVDTPDTPSMSVPKLDVTPTTSSVKAGTGAPGSPANSDQSSAGLRPLDGNASAAGAGQSSPSLATEGKASEEAEIGVSSVEDPFNTASGALALGRVAVYILDPRGLMTPFELGANPDYEYQFAEMDKAAESTGGHAFYNSNRLDLLMKQIAAEGSNYYRLTYSPTDKEWNGKFRRLQVKITASTKNPLTSALTGKPAVGPLHLGYRPGYYASESGAPTPIGQPTPRTTVNSAGPASFTLAREEKPNASNGLPHTLTPRESLQASMTLGALPSTEIVFAASVKPVGGTIQLTKTAVRPSGDFTRPKFRNQPHRQLNIVFATDIHGLILPVAADGSHHGKVEFVTVIYSDKGDVVNSLITNLSMDLSDATYRKMLSTGIGAHQSIAVPVKGEYIIRLGVHDKTSDRIGTVEIHVSDVLSEEASSASRP